MRCAHGKFGRIQWEPRHGSGQRLLLLRLCPFWRDCIGHAKYGGENLEDDPAIENPEKVSDQCAKESKQSLNWDLLERKHHPSNSSN
jgi:hypothetical protein